MPLLCEPNDAVRAVAVAKRREYWVTFEMFPMLPLAVSSFSFFLLNIDFANIGKQRSMQNNEKYQKYQKFPQ
jgi:hypothetical protein